MFFLPAQARTDWSSRGSSPELRSDSERQKRAVFVDGSRSLRCARDDRGRDSGIRAARILVPASPRVFEATI
jgi:hypothetical protein